MTRLDAATASFTEVAAWLGGGEGSGRADARFATPNAADEVANRAFRRTSSGAADDTRGLVIVAFGAHEAHGAHLPLGTDTIVADAVARELADRLDAVLLPTVPYGASWSTAGYPGGAALGVGTVAAIAVDLGRAAAAAGARAFVIVNGDFGNRGPLAAASDQLTGSVLPTLVLDYPGLDEAAAAVRTSRPAAPGLAHGEEIETSLLRHLAPETVRMQLAAPFYPEFPADFGTRPVSIDRFSPTAVFGDPTVATAAKGAAIFSAVVEASVREVREFVQGNAPASP